jgi:hypothetical protein
VLLVRKKVGSLLIVKEIGKGVDQKIIIRSTLEFVLIVVMLEKSLKL